MFGVFKQLQGADSGPPGWRSDAFTETSLAFDIHERQKCDDTALQLFAEDSQGIDRWLVTSIRTLSGAFDQSRPCKI